MEKDLLLTYAILTVNDTYKKDYYEYFVPFIVETIKKTNLNTISANEIKEKLYSYFKLDLPISVVNTILKKRLRTRGYLKLENRMYLPNYEKLNNSKFEQTRMLMLEKHEKIVNDLLDYAKVNYEVNVDKSWAETALEKFINKYQINFLKSPKDSDFFDDKDNSNTKDHIIVSSFIREIQKEESVSFNFLIDIIKGNMLVNAIYFTEPDKINMQFKGTEIFFDTSFIIYALGLAGGARKEPCMELIKMLRGSNAILRCFRHNIEEVIGVLEWCKNNLSTSKPDIHGTINYFIENGYNPSDIERIIYDLDNIIYERLKLKIIDNVPFDNYEHVISENDLRDTLTSEIKYNRENALEKDIKSIASIVRLRNGKKTYHVEDCRAIFVTTNYSLANSVRNLYFNEETPKIIPPVIHDSVITNLVWLKNPNSAPELPVKRLIAECYAAAAPKEHLWERYIETLEIYEQTNQITGRDLITLRYTQGARELLVEKTLGDEEAITIGTVQDILKQIRSEENKRLIEAEETKNIEIDKIKLELDKYQKQVAVTNEERNKKIKKSAQGQAKIATISCSILILLFLGCLMYITPFVQNLNMPSALKISIFLLTSVLLPLLGLFNITLLRPLKYLNDRFYQYFLNRINKKYL